MLIGKRGMWAIEETETKVLALKNNTILNHGNFLEIMILLSEYYPVIN